MTLYLRRCHVIHNLTFEYTASLLFSLLGRIQTWIKLNEWMHSLSKASRVSALCTRLNKSFMPQVLKPFKALLEAIPNTGYAKDFVRSRNQIYFSFFERSLPVKEFQGECGISEEPLLWRPKRHTVPHQESLREPFTERWEVKSHCEDERMEDRIKACC